MLSTSLQIIRAALAADPSVSVADRNRILQLIRGQPPTAEQPPTLGPTQPPRILNRLQVSQCLGQTLRNVDKLAAQGVLKRVTLPGRKRAAGFLASQLESLLCQ